MHSRPEREDITVILGRYASGEDQAFDELYFRYRDQMVRIANCAIARQRLRDVCCDAELVVDQAFIDLRTARDHGDLAKIDDGEKLVGLLRLYVTHEIAHERDRCRANKRGGQKLARVSLDHCGPDIAESLVTRLDPPEKLLFAREAFDRLRDLLAGEPVRQVIFTVRFEGYTIEQIGGRLNKSPRSVKRCVLDIRRIYEREQAHH